MKLWKLVSTLRDETGNAIAIAKSEPEWADYGIWLENFSHLVRIQDREKLDRELPKEFVERVFDETRLSFFVSTDGTLRSRRTFPGDEELSAAEAYSAFGGDAMEEALEYGSFKP